MKFLTLINERTGKSITVNIQHILEFHPSDRETVTVVNIADGISVGGYSIHVRHTFIELSQMIARALNPEA